MSSTLKKVSKVTKVDTNESNEPKVEIKEPKEPKSDKNNELTKKEAEAKKLMEEERLKKVYTEVNKNLVLVFPPLITNNFQEKVSNSIYSCILHTIKEIQDTENIGEYNTYPDHIYLINEKSVKKAQVKSGKKVSNPMLEFTGNNDSDSDSDSDNDNSTNSDNETDDDVKVEESNTLNSKQVIKKRITTFTKSGKNYLIYLMSSKE